MIYNHWGLLSKNSITVGTPVWVSTVIQASAGSSGHRASEDEVTLPSTVLPASLPGSSPSTCMDEFMYPLSHHWRQDMQHHPILSIRTETQAAYSHRRSTIQRVRIQTVTEPTFHPWAGSSGHRSMVDRTTLAGKIVWYPEISVNPNWYHSLSWWKTEREKMLMSILTTVPMADEKEVKSTVCLRKLQFLTGSTERQNLDNNSKMSDLQAGLWFSSKALAYVRSWLQYSACRCAHTHVPQFTFESKDVWEEESRNLGAER